MGNCGYSGPTVSDMLIFVQRVSAPINFYSISIYSAPISISHCSKVKHRSVLALIPQFLH